MRIGTDTGGTFTDVVDSDGRIAKVPSTPSDPGDAVREGLARFAPPNGGVTLAHGTTVATNALLERRGAAVVLVTTDGIGDVIEIARQDRPSLYDPEARRPEPLVPRERRVEVAGRLGPDGSELEPIDRAAIADVDVAGADAVAVCLLHADVNPAHERAVAEMLRERGLDVSCSHEVSAELREYERTVTTVINASLRPVCRSYLRALTSAAEEVVVMTSAGGLLPGADAAELPAALLLSGPAGGVRAGAAVAVANGFADAVTFDMGGTSTDVCLVLGGVPAPAAQREVAGFTVRFPSLDVLTIGAGGGSIASIDPGGALVVGPRSAGARPGPACYGWGGTEPTVTDANVAAGRIPTGADFGGITLHERLAQEAIAGAGLDAEGVIAVVNANMERALRSVTVERGVDPRGVALVAFGGAGPLHACDLADALGIETVLVPARAGVLSAVGILTAPVQRDLVRSWPTPTDHEGLDEALGALAERARELLEGGGRSSGEVQVEVAVDCRYAGQSHEITVAAVDHFESEHRRRNGYARPGDPVEVVALRATATVAAPLDIDDLPVPDRSVGPDARVGGPVTLAEPDCTIWVPPGWVAQLGEAGALRLTRESR
ncbi:MAG: hydantoinase/oxoprolinase family protein [Acidimicrobiales bacterium]